MGDEYHPKFPKAKLHEVVTNYITAMRRLGRNAKCTVTFVRRDGSASPASVHGWLLKDTRPESGGNRYLLLEDGDVWRDVESPTASGAAAGQREWLLGPDDDLVSLLARSLANAQTGGSGFLEEEEHVELRPYVVADRRREQHPYDGPERRQGE